ncbi:hypothetical protein BHM03_00037448 [Ensete ventricosum]|nr:hypothetical protein BHM03_00037448 [Ensete ventricosum]
MYQSARLPVHGPPAIGRYRQNRPLAVDFGRRRSIEGEKGKKKRKRRKKKEERRKKKKSRRIPRAILLPHTVVAREPSSPARHCRPRVAVSRRRSRVARGRFFSRAGRKIEATFYEDSSLDSRDDSDVSDIHPRSMFNDVTDGLDEKEVSPDPVVGAETKVGSKEELDDKSSKQESPDHSSSDGKDDSDDELIIQFVVLSHQSFRIMTDMVVDARVGRTPPPAEQPMGARRRTRLRWPSSPRVAQAMRMDDAIVS